ncbi:hypothetical protein NQ318_012031 [Aromia moschata]|uniref:Uncharacterized protein n=1 Tax=Aromia moschata TaxID=1265417 RepID=A0AAV8YF20_9CUCU|nr:hypothetical protein NQ318_012031 [Aromia moschata]
MKNNNNFNREDGYRLSNTWRLAIPRASDLECHGQPSSTDVQPTIAEPRITKPQSPNFDSKIFGKDRNSLKPVFNAKQFLSSGSISTRYQYRSTAVGHHIKSFLHQIDQIY